MRVSLCPISMAMLSSAPAITRAVTGSMRVRVRAGAILAVAIGHPPHCTLSGQHKAATRIHAQRPARRHHRRAIDLEDDGRAMERVAGARAWPLVVCSRERPTLISD